MCFFKVLSIAGKIKLYYNECVFINTEVGLLYMDINKKENALKKLLCLTEYIYLVCFALLTIYSFLKTTTFPSPILTEDGRNIYFNEFTSVIPFHMEYVLIGIILIRYVILRENRLRDIFLAIIVYKCANYAVEVNLNDNILLFTLLILGAKGISFQKIMKIYTGIVALLLNVTILAALCGVIDNISFGEKEKLAFGIVYSTDFAAHVFFLVLCIWYLRGEKVTLWEASAAAGLGGLIYIFSAARCSTICLCLVSGIIFLRKWIQNRCRKKQVEYQMNPYMSALLSMSFVIAAAFSVIATIIYSPKVSWMNEINKLVSDRLVLGKKAVEISGFHLWGKHFRLRGHWAEGLVTNKYYYLDSSYMQMTIMYGLVISALALIAFLLIGYHAYKQKQWVFLWILALMSLHGIIEQRIWNLAYCPFILALFARFDTDEKVRIIRWKRRS